VDDEIKCEGESEISFAILAKCEKNLAIKTIEDMDEDTMNVEFYVELAFLEEWIAKPKYESEYGKYTTIVAKEGSEKMKPTIEGVKVVLDLTDFDKSVKLAVSKVKADAEEELDKKDKRDEEILKKTIRVMLKLKKKKKYA
jgi:hypothetical protein